MCRLSEIVSSAVSYEGFVLCFGILFLNKRISLIFDFRMFFNLDKFKKLLEANSLSFVKLQVDENGKISRLRRECPSERCGAGVFMAAMSDRHYCGKCGYTLVYDGTEGK